MSTPTASARLDRRKLRELVERVVVETGGELEDLVEQRAGSRRLVRVVVDRDGGVSLDDIAEVSRAVSTALDASDVMGETPYVLEVTSPGVDRPLTEPRHWRRAAGRLVKAVLVQGGELLGRVADADEDGATLLVDGEPRRLRYAEVVKARVQVEFNRAGSDADDDAEGDGGASGSAGAEDAGTEDTPGRDAGAGES